MLASLQIKAQTGVKAVFRATVYDSAAVAFFTKHTQINNAKLIHGNLQPNRLDLFLADYYGYPSERYVFTFEGDRHLLNKKYPDFPVYFANELLKKYRKNINGITGADTVFEVSTTIRRDSVTHVFEFYNKRPDYLSQSNGPTLKQKLEALTDSIQQRIKQIKPKPTHDSIVVMSGIVNTKGLLSDLNLIDSETNPYSTELMSILADISRWFPLSHGGKKIPWIVKIAVRIKPDQTLHISILNT